MLKLTVPRFEGFDEETQQFVEADAVELELEHSLASLSKWESRWQVPFLRKEEKTTEQTLSYVRDMMLTPNVPEEVYKRLTDGNVTEIYEYINSKQTATTINERGPSKASNEIITAEVIYHWMVSLQIPFIPCETWHLNRLITLVRVSNEKNQPKKKMSRAELAARNRELNAQRRAGLGTRG